MLERGEICSSAAITTGLAAPREEQIDPDRTTLALRHDNDGYTCNNENVYAVPRIELQESEWIDPESIDAEISRLVTGSSTTTATITRNNPRRCCRTSTSSGYSSHSPPLSAGSYSCYASATGCQGFFAIKDQFGRGLAVIHEGETIPRPIWPCGPAEFYHDDSNTEYDLEHLRSGIYACCSCVSPYSYCEWNQEQSVAAGKSAREVLLELSRTLNSVIEHETDVTPEEILHDISHTVAHGMALRRACYEHIGCNNLSPANVRKCPLLGRGRCASGPCGKGACQPGCNKISVSRVNPINSKLYGNAVHGHVQNSLWNAARDVADDEGNVERRLQPAAKRDDEGNVANAKKPDERVVPAVFLLTREREDHARVDDNDRSGSRGCERPDGTARKNVNAKDVYASNLHAETNMKETTVGLVAGVKQNRSCLATGEPEYTTQLGGSDGSSSSEGIVSPGKTDWNHNGRSFGEHLDFTLDVTRAERLGRVIAKAKRKRQWCRALIALFGLVFFVLSVVIVSLSVTRGRKVFGSM